MHDSFPSASLQQGNHQVQRKKLRGNTLSLYEYIQGNHIDGGGIVQSEKIRQGDNNLELFKDRCLGFSVGKDNTVKDASTQMHTLQGQGWFQNHHRTSEFRISCCNYSETLCIENWGQVL